MSLPDSALLAQRPGDHHEKRCCAGQIGETTSASNLTLPLSHPGRECWGFLTETPTVRGKINQSSLRKTRDLLKEEYCSKLESNSPDHSLSGHKECSKKLKNKLFFLGGALSSYRFKNLQLCIPTVTPCTRRDHDMLSHSGIFRSARKDPWCCCNRILLITSSESALKALESLMGEGK